jgi:hypothetical protein
LTTAQEQCLCGTLIFSMGSGVELSAYFFTTLQERMNAQTGNPLRFFPLSAAFLIRGTGQVARKATATITMFDIVNCPVK